MNQNGTNVRVRLQTGSPFGDEGSSRWNPEGTPPWLPIVSHRSAMKGTDGNINTSGLKDEENQLPKPVRNIRFGPVQESHSFNVDDPPERIRSPRVEQPQPKMVRIPSQGNMSNMNKDNSRSFRPISTVSPSTVFGTGDVGRDTPSPTLHEYLKKISTSPIQENEARNNAFGEGKYFPTMGGRRRTKQTRHRKTRSISFSRKKRKGTKRKDTRRKDMKRKGTRRKTRRRLRR